MIRRIAVILCTACILQLSQIYPQTARSGHALPDSGSDHFEVSIGSSFAASPREAVPPSLHPVVRDVSEAAEVIRNNSAASRLPGEDKLIAHAIDGILRSLDPHSIYYDPTEYGNLRLEQESEYSGIGITIDSFRSSAMPETYVVAITPGSPAAAGGIKFGDRIVEVDGESMSGRSLEQVGRMIRGPEGSTVRVTLERPNGQLYSSKLRRRSIHSPSITDAYLLKKGIGYIALKGGFNFTTAAEFRVAMERLELLNATSVILDLRGNTGGIVEQSVRVAEVFLDADTLIASQNGRNEFDRRLWKSNARIPSSLPLVVLVDNNTASAAEIVAGALQDNRRAVIVGERTFGKALVQSIFDLPSGAGLALTTARYLTPAGRSIQRNYDNGTYDYSINRRGSDQDNDATRRETAQTGAGIVPDHFICAKADTAFEAMMDEAAFFFVRGTLMAYLSDSYRTEEKPPRNEPLDLTDEQPLELFLKFASSNYKWQPTARAEKLPLAVARKYLNYYFAAATSGIESAGRVITRNDPQVITAINAIPEAAIMAEALHGKAAAIKKRLAESHTQRVKGRNRRN